MDRVRRRITQSKLLLTFIDDFEKYMNVFLSRFLFKESPKFLPVISFQFNVAALLEDSFEVAKWHRCNHVQKSHIVEFECA